MRDGRTTAGPSMYLRKPGNARRRMQRSFSRWLMPPRMPASWGIPRWRTTSISRFGPRTIEHGSTAPTFTGSTGTRLADGVKETEWYIRKHPADPMGFFILAQFTWETKPEAALGQLSQTLQLDPGFAPALYARAWLLQRLGRIQESLPDLEATVRLAPGNVRALDQLGLAYLSLDRPAEAEKTLRTALSASPADREVLMHLGRALMALDRVAEAQQYFDQFRKIPVQQALDPRREAGMIELATLPATDRTRRQIERLQKEAGEHPNQPELQLRLAELLLSNGRWDGSGSRISRTGDKKCRQPDLGGCGDITGSRRTVRIGGRIPETRHARQTLCTCGTGHRAVFHVGTGRGAAGARTGDRG